MRILFTFAGRSGHFNPLVPIARAAQAAGHTVVFAGQQAMVPMIEAAGFTAFATSKSNIAPTERIPLQKVDLQREDEVMRDGFASRLARKHTTETMNLCATWQPDLIVCDEVDFGALIAAEKLGLPYASVLVILEGSFIRHELVSDALNEVRAEFDLPPDPDLTMLSRYLVLSPAPPSYRNPAYPLPATAHSLHPLPDAKAEGSLPSWVEALPERPTVYFTLGTVFPLESGDLFQRVLAGLRDLPINLIVTVGREIDPAEFGEQPAHIHIERYIPQALILPRCQATVTHGGSGSVIGALAHGLPMVLIPMGADQPQNAARCEALGVARVLDAVDATPEMIREAVGDVLENPRYRQAAQRLRDEIRVLPPPAYAVALLERLVREKRPLYRV
ncbi:MAG: glycosyltransferase [Anaerolineae bacterium]